jgi:plastocyanin
MNRLNRRRFLALGAASTASVVLVACGNESPSEADLNPTQIPDIAGAPPTLAPITSTPQTEAGGGDAGGGGAAGGPVTISAVELAFEPSEMDVAPGQTLVLQNDGMLQHDLAVDAWGGPLTELLNGGETAEFTIPEDAAVGDTFEYYCSVPGHKEGGMVGTFTVVEAGSETGAGAGEEEAAAGTTEGEAPVISAIELAFEPAEMDVSPGQTLTLQNDGMLQHDIAVDAWGGPLTELLNGGESQEFTIPEDAAVGEQFEYYCSVPGHKEGGMVGTFTVVEAGAAAAAAPEEEAPAEEATPEDEPAAAAGTTEGAATGEAVTILALDTMSFDPNEVEVSPGQTLTLQNDGFLQHDLAVDDWGGSLTPLLNNGETAEFTIPEDAAVGEQFEYYCTVPGHKEAGMTGTFTIVEGGGEAAAAPATEEESTPEEEATADQAAAPAGDAATEVEVSAVDLAFEPTELTIAADTDVTVTLVNNGALQHDFVVEDSDFATDLLNGGETGEVVVNLPEGEYTYICSVPGHKEAGMTGTLTVVAGGGEAAAAPAAGSEESTPAAASGGDASDPMAVEIVATEWAFEPADFEVAPGGTITLTNNGTVEHAMKADAFGGAFIEAGAGQSARFTVPADAEVGEAIEYTAVNSNATSLGMGGTITIVEGDGSAAGATPMASPAASPEAEESSSTGGGSDAIEVVATDLAFDQSEITIPADTDVTVTLNNEGMLEHDFVVEDTDFATDIIGGGESTETVVNLPAGEYTFYCSVPGHREAGMQGTLTVE